MKLSTVPISSIQHVLAYGAPKTGKTEIVGKLAESHNLIWFDLENGFKTLQKMQDDWQQRVELIRLPDTKSWAIGIETLLKVFDTSRALSICEAHGKVACPRCGKDSAPVTVFDPNLLGPHDIVVIDTLSQCAISVMNNITKSEQDDYKPSWEDYRRQGAIMDKLLTNIQQAPFNVVCISHEVDVSKDEKIIKLSGMAGTTNFSRNTGKFFDHVVYCEVKNRGHSFGSSTVYSTLALTGSRLDVAMEKMGEPSLAPIFDGGWKEGLEQAKAARLVSKLSGSSASSQVSSTTSAASKLEVLKNKLANK